MKRFQQHLVNTRLTFSLTMLLPALCFARQDISMSLKPDASTWTMMSQEAAPENSDTSNSDTGNSEAGHPETGNPRTGNSAEHTSSTTMRNSDATHPAWILDLESKAWPGFLTGLSGFEDFIMPVSMPTIFEDPFITTDLRVLYMFHDIPDRSELNGGQVHVAALQARIALTERLAFIATKDGYSWVDTGITRAGDGFNDVAIGFKYAIYADPENQFLVTSGIRWEWANGSRDAFQGSTQELSPFISVAKGWDRWHFLGTVTGRIPTNRHRANSSLVWNLHLDYQLTETFYPLIEVNGMHWLSNGGILPTSVDYLDVGSLGASRVRGHDFFSCGIGFRWEIMENVSMGLTWEFPLESAAENAQQNRITLNTVISF